MTIVYMCLNCDRIGKEEEFYDKDHDIYSCPNCKVGEHTINDNISSIVSGIFCPYCGSVATLKDSKIIYGKSYGNAFICNNFPKCNTFVGVHKATNKPLGTLANNELREFRKKAHSLFDPLWKLKIIKEKCSKKKARTAGYKWLSIQTEIDYNRCHIAMMNIDECKKVIQVCTKYKLT